MAVVLYYWVYREFHFCNDFPRFSVRKMAFHAGCIMGDHYESETLCLSMNVIGKMFDVSAQSILNWVRNYAIANYENPTLKDAIIVELDEMLHFLNSKKQIWIWKAYCRETGELIDWEYGGRDKKYS